MRLPSANLVLRMTHMQHLSLSPCKLVSCWQNQSQQLFLRWRRTRYYAMEAILPGRKGWHQAGSEAWGRPQVVYGAYLGVGPWAAAVFLEGEPPGLVFLGRLLYFQGGRPHWVQSVEPAINITLHNAATLLPLTLWFATVASR